MLYGATNNPLRPVQDEIRTLAGLGFDYLELCLDPPECHPENLLRQRDQIRMTCEETGLMVAVGHLPTFVWLADIYPSVRSAAVAEVVAALEACARFDIKTAVLHPGYLTGLLRFTP
ncbi:MAG: TIM barrel protein, partial [Thermodesulfobacteriota bacterium]